MKFINRIKKIFSIQWGYYLIACLIVSVGAFFIHSGKYSPPNFNLFFMWLPAVWLMIYIMAFLFGLFIGEEK